MSEFAAGLTGLEFAVIAAVALASAFVRGLSGFGLALVLVPVLSLMVDPTQAVVAANILGVVMGLASFRGARLTAERSTRIIAPLAMLLTPAGLALLSITQQPVARVLIALIALTAFVAVLLPQPKGAWQHGRALSAGTGVATGLCAGFAGMPGPPVVAFYLGRRVEKAMARASMFVIFLATSLTACVAAWVLDIGGSTALWLGAALAPVVLLGNWLGSLAFGKVDDRLWRMAAGALITATAIVALARLW